jgi:hypothetical protein
MSLYDDVQDSITQIIASYQTVVADGKLTLSELWTLFQNATATLVQLVERYSGYSGTEKRDVVLAALGTLYDEIIAPVDIKGVPNFLEPLVDKSLRELLLTLAGPAIDSLVNIFNKTGWGTSGAGQPTGGSLPPGFNPY